MPTFQTPASTISSMRRSPARLQRTYASSLLRPCSSTSLPTIASAAAPAAWPGASAPSGGCSTTRGQVCAGGSSSSVSGCSPDSRTLCPTTTSSCSTSGGADPSRRSHTNLSAPRHERALDLRRCENVRGPRPQRRCATPDECSAGGAACAMAGALPVADGAWLRSPVREAQDFSYRTSDNCLVRQPSSSQALDTRGPIFLAPAARATGRATRAPRADRPSTWPSAQLASPACSPVA